MPKNAPQIVRIVCDQDGFKGCWVELDVSEWGYAEYLDIWATPYPLVVIRYFEKYSTNWRMVADDGKIISHPGKYADRDVWTGIYRSLGVGASRKVGNWLGTACLLAATEALTIEPKSSEPDQGESAGTERTRGRDESTDAVVAVDGVADGEARS